MDRERQAAILGRNIVFFLPGMLVLFGLYLTSRYSYLLFHSLVEIFSIAVACGISMFFWNSRRFLDNGYFPFIGIAYLFVGGMDLIHTLAYKGMGVFPGYDANLPTQLWVAARYIESLSLLAAPLFLRRRLKPKLVFIGYAVVVSLLLGSIFWNVFPDCFVEGIGLTPFKKISEYVISLILLASIALLFQRRREFDTSVFQLLIASIMVTIGSELAFTLYTDVYGLLNLIGHLLKIVSFYLIYKAFIEAGLTRPYDLLFRNLKQSEEALRESEERFRVIAESTPIPVVITQASDGMILYANEEYGKFLGLPTQELLGRRSIDYYGHPDERQVVLDRLSEHGRLEGHELQGKRGDGTLFWAVVSSRLLTFGGEQTIFTAFQDITERKRTERALRKSEERLSTVVTNVPLVLFAMDRDGIFTLSEGKGLEILGLEPGQVVGMSVYDVYCDVPEILDNIRRTLTGEMVTSVVDVGGIWYETWYNPIKDQSNEVVGLIGVAADITERVRAEEQIKASLAEKEVLLREIHHRVKNNLQSLIYLIDMQAETIEDPAVLHALEDLQGRASAMGMVHEKLYQTRDLARIDFGDYLEDLTAHLYHALASSQDITLRVDAADLLINVNIAIPCGLIVNELVTNALQHAFPKGLTGLGKPVRSDCEIHVEFGLCEGEYVLVVSDNGVGLPPGLDWRATESLGLKLVNIWATYQLGGSIEVDSRPRPEPGPERSRRGSRRSGTAFTIRFADRRLIQ